MVKASLIDKKGRLLDTSWKGMPTISTQFRCFMHLFLRIILYQSSKKKRFWRLGGFHNNHAHTISIWRENRGMSTDALPRIDRSHSFLLLLLCPSRSTVPTTKLNGMH